MKILIDCRFWGPKDTGLGRYTKNLVENLLAIDNKNNYCLIFRQKADYEKLCNNLPALKINRLFDYKILNVVHYSLKEQLIFPWFISQLKPDLIHFPHFNLPFFWQGKYIVTIHDLIKHQSKGMATTTRHPWIYFLKYAGYKLVIKQAIKTAKKIIVPSEAVKKEMITTYKVSQEKIAVIYEGVDNQYQISQPKAGRSRAENIKYKISEKVLQKYKIKKPFVIYTGNVYPHKNIRRLILAVKMVNSVRVNCHQTPIKLVIVCGRSIFLNRLRKEIKELKAESFVLLPGFISDNKLKFLYSKAELFITPSLMEGFGLPALEAMATGCLVICSNIPVFKEIYDKAAIYFYPENVEDIKEKIINTLNLSLKMKEQIRKEGYKQVKQYSWRKCAEETLKTYEGCFSL